MFWVKRKKLITDEPIMKSDLVKPLKHKIDFTEEVLDREEHDEVAVIASAILSTSYDDAKVRVKSIRRVDQDKEAAAIIAAAVLAHDKPESTFRLVRITEEGSSKDA